MQTRSACLWETITEGITVLIFETHLVHNGFLEITSGGTVLLTQSLSTCMVLEKSPLSLSLSFPGPQNGTH